MSHSVLSQFIWTLSLLVYSLYWESVALFAYWLLACRNFLVWLLKTALSLWYLLVVSPGASSSLPLVIISSSPLLHWRLPGDCSFWYEQETQVSIGFDHLDAPQNLHFLHLKVIFPYLCFPVGLLLSLSSFSNQNYGNVLYYVIVTHCGPSALKEHPLPTALLQHGVLVFLADCAGSLISLSFFSQGPNSFPTFPRYHIVSRL